MISKCLKIILLSITFLFNTCAIPQDLRNYHYIRNENINLYNVKDNETFSLIKYYYSPLIINDSAICLSVAYVWEYSSGDTIRILCLNSKNKVPTPGIVNYSISKEGLTPNKKIYAYNDTLYSKMVYKTIVGNLDFQDE